MGHLSIRSSRFLKEFPQAPQLLTAPDFGLQPARLLFLVDECPKPIVALSARRSRGRRPRLCRRASIAAPDHRLQNPSESQSQFRTTQIESTKNWVRSFILPYPASLAPSPCRGRLEGTQPRVEPEVLEPIGEMHPGSLVHLIPGPRIFRSARVTRNGLAEFTRPRRLSVENFFSPSSVFPKMVARPLTYQNLTALSIACHTA